MKKTNVLLVVILLTVLIVPSIALATWWNPFTWNWNIFSWFSKPQTSITQPNQNQNKTQSQTGQTASWQTYTNDKQNYQISYPAGATIIGDSKYNKYCITLNYKNGGYVIIDSLKDEQDALNKGIIDMAGCSGIDGLGSGYTQINQSIFVGGKTYQAQGYQYQNKTNDPYNEYLDTALIFPLTDNITIQIGYINNGGKQVSDDEYNQIMSSLKQMLSTFKFTTQTSVQTTTSSVIENTQSITITSPVVGQKLITGKTYNVTWSSTNPAYSKIVTNLEIFSSKNVSMGFLDSNLQNNGNYNYPWMVGSFLPSGEYYLELQNAMNPKEIFATSGIFSIVSTTPQITPSITSISPDTSYVDNFAYGLGTSITVKGNNFLNGYIYLTDSNGTELAILLPNNSLPTGNVKSNTEFSISIPNQVLPGNYAIVVQNAPSGLKSKPYPITVAQTTAPAKPSTICKTQGDCQQGYDCTGEAPKIGNQPIIQLCIPENVLYPK